MDNIFNYVDNDYDSDSSPSINRDNAAFIRQGNRNSFNRNVHKQALVRSRSIASKFGMSARLRAFSSLPKFGLSALGPAAIMATTMQAALTAKDYAFDRTMAQDSFAGAVDIAINQTPMLASAAVFGAAERGLSGKFSGSAGGFLSKRAKLKGFGGKAVSMAGAAASFMIASSIFRPVQESLTNFVAGERSAGLLSAAMAGNQQGVEAELIKQGTKEGYDFYGKSQSDFFNPWPQLTANKTLLAEYAGKVKARGDLPGSNADANTRQLNKARIENKRAMAGADRGFWSNLFSGNANKWSQENNFAQKNENINQEINTRYEALNRSIVENNKTIIEFYSRE